MGVGGPGVSQYASYETSYEQRTPYVTAAEYNNSPQSIDTMNLIAGGSAQANQTALVETIGRASSWVDQFTCGAWGTLCATQNTESARIWSGRDGLLKVHPRWWPILSVDSLSYSPVGAGFANAASVTPAGNVWIEPQEFIVNPFASGNFSLSYWPGGVAPTREYYLTYVFTNGWPNTTLAASVAAGATSIQPLNVTGLYPGTMLTLYDLPYDEAIQVSQSYVPGSAIVPFDIPLSFNHGIGATITNLPPAVKQATLLMTTAFIKLRGSGALVVSDMGAQLHQQTGFSQQGGSDVAQAETLLMPFKMVYVGT